MNVADIIVEELQARGVSFVAALNGHGLDPLLLACRDAGMRVIDVRNEQPAAYMAEVAGRLGRSVGVCAVSGAVAHANALTGVLNACFDGAPMLLITGVTPLSRLGAGDFQDFNPVPMTAPVCKYARLVDAPVLAAQIVHEAFAAATSGRPGPVHLSLPIDVAQAEVVRALGEAERPLLVAGSGVYYAGGEPALARFAAQQRIPVVVPIWDRGAIPRPMDEFLGVIGAASGGARILPDADLVLLLGAEVDYRVGQQDDRPVGVKRPRGHRPRQAPVGPENITVPCDRTFWSFAFECSTDLASANSKQTAAVRPQNPSAGRFSLAEVGR